MKKTIKTLIAGTAMVGIAGIASATPTIYLSTTGAAGSYTAVASRPTGNVQYNTPFGIWDIVIASGLTYNALGTASVPTMELDIQATTANATGGTLYVGFAANGFTDPLGGIDATLSGHVVSGAAETITQTVFADPSNTQPGTTLPTGSVITTLSGSLPINVSTSGLLPGTSPAVLGEVVEINSTGATSDSIDSSFTAAPDGGATAMMLGAALSGLALLKRKVLA